jgi:hypothetical protein
MFDVLRKCKQNNLSIKCELNLFDRVFQPTLQYGYEIWVFSNTSHLEKLRIGYCEYTQIKTLQITLEITSFMWNYMYGYILCLSILKEGCSSFEQNDFTR